MKTALLLSGGMDSLCLAYWKGPDVAITIDYGQRAAQAEIDASTVVCESLGIEHHIVRIDCCALGSGDMAGTAAGRHAPASDWWPYRNQLLATFAAMKAIGLGATKLLIGSVKSDGQHADGTPEFVARLSALMAMQEGGMVVEAPGIGMTTAELARHAAVPASLLSWAHSCHKANVACGACRGCTKYLEVLDELADIMDRSGKPSPA
ncbi:MAG: 7-cyano-7-deazaguanine synthase [Betaproteobacteria bacterium]|nr:7-cyano-7-deazaguanine synthase [Betaproteobacteria bacterium]MBU6511750.1 7-cyano-7-deazaguanine synthase [Betaproteobacteria bacterium]MDE1954243.1 7-cyano-7-deazaguanine synthase [Betaproteobacteria bacterium]MDE2153302.1 7-cyano-7-deazaguanine synthase [Betaproteobacteria bacterium]